MAGQKILVLGATGPAGICLLRELIHRQHYTIAYARNPSKIPEDLTSSPYLETVKGDMTSTSDISPAMAQTSVVISLLGPDIMQKGLDPKLFSNMYGSTVLPLMREHGVRRIFAMTTLSIKLPEDHWTHSRD
ncbi:hypothetical protein B9Z65_7381 [Elsinoe australis]|uniref:NAD(P)-binding domain-containing protein n=1 Tax=Elsinoe australis TaxID=40998 RepID=A0A2P7YBZ8_9PEZI|nr:hypothetical protein B9Z65_7381 [Elsinoe australis]